MEDGLLRVMLQLGSRMSPKVSRAHGWGFWAVIGWWELWPHQQINPLVAERTTGRWGLIGGSGPRGACPGRAYLLSVSSSFSPSASQLPWVEQLFSTFYHDVLPRLRFRAMELADCGLRPLKLCAKNTLFLLNFLISYFGCRDTKLTYTRGCIENQEPAIGAGQVWVGITNRVDGAVKLHRHSAQDHWTS